MNKFEKETAIRNYFSMWVQRDFSLLGSIFTPDIYYNECYGPEYSGLQEIKCWIEDMLCMQNVLEWTIKQFIHQDDIVVVEWSFKDQQNKTEHAFDGVSIIQFRNDGKISSIKEFESKKKHTIPYRGKT